MSDYENSPLGDWAEPKDEDEEVWRLTEKGVEYVVGIYADYQRGMSVEDLETKYNMNPGEPGTETHHAEFKILMAMGNLSGVFDYYDEIVELRNRLDGIEEDFDKGI